MKFDTLDHLNTWMESDDRHKLVVEGQKLVEVDNEPPSEIRQGSIVPIERQTSVKGGEAPPSGPPAMWKITVALQITVRSSLNASITCNLVQLHCFLL